jgi:heme-NO-binding protein
MHGLVNQAIRDLAVKVGGEPLWSDIKSRAGVDLEVFVSMQAYPDDVTYRLVESASSVLGISAAEMLHAFGKHWILYTARQGYGAIFEMMGRTLPDFLGNLDAMHARLSLSMPELRPPSFVCEHVSDGHMRLEYWTHRPGLAPMVLGLLDGLAEMYGVSIDVIRGASRENGDDHDEFIIDYTPLAADINFVESPEAADAAPSRQ